MITAERSAVVTGMGVIAPNGLGIDAYWAATLAGESGIRPISRFDASAYPVRLAGEVIEFDPTAQVPGRLIAQTDRMTHFALAAADQALADSGVELEALGHFGASVVTASSSGGFEFGQRELEKLWTRGGSYVGAYQSIAWFYAASTGQISIRHKLRGPCGVLASEQAGAIDAAGHARRVLRGGTRLVVTGGTDASLCPWGFVTQLSTGTLTTDPDPARAYRPFDSAASGFLPGEGGAVLVVEERDEAWARRGEPGYGVLAGYASTFDPPPRSDRGPRLRAAMELALSDAGLPADQVDLVLADGSGIPEQDAQEARAITEVFGAYAVPVTVPKTMTGRLYAGAALDIVTALLAIRDGVVPPTVAVDRVADDYLIDLVTGGPRVAESVRNVLVLARGRGGFNSALVVRADS